MPPMPSSGFRMMSWCSAWNARIAAAERVTSVGAMNCGNSRIASFSGWSRSKAALVEDLRAFALGLLQQVRGVEELGIERRILAHQHRVDVGQGQVLRRGDRVPHGELRAGLAGDGRRRVSRCARMRGHAPAADPQPRSRHLADPELMAAPLRFAHHREGGVLVGVEGSTADRRRTGCFMGKASSARKLLRRRDVLASACSQAERTAPATTPQNADPMPSRRDVPTASPGRSGCAASRWCSSLQRGGQSAADGAQQRQAGHGGDQLPREGGQQARDRAARTGRSRGRTRRSHRRGRVAPRRDPRALRAPCRSPR